MRPDDWTWWAGASLAWMMALTAALYAGAQWQRWRAARLQASDALRFFEWSRRTMITIATRDGEVYANSFQQLYLPTGNRLDEVWREPYSVSLWTIATPEAAAESRRAAIEAYGAHKPPREGTGE